ncbi:MAG: hypothetical protein U9R64_12165 [Pseudomonadota bacterium]|nr:hypothetical protein [Pseudomonadota bacterium]
MIRRLAPLACLALGMCATLPTVNCANADRVRAAAALALQTLDRVCPAPFNR